MFSLIVEESCCKEGDDILEMQAQSHWQLAEI